MWQETVKPYVQSGGLTVIGVVQEQHPDRAKLYAQWRRLHWPIFVDSLNLLDLSVVPIPVAIDASGIVRHERIRPQDIVKKFVEVDYPATAVPEGYNRTAGSAPDRLYKQAESLQTAKAWRDLGDACFLTSRGLEPARTPSTKNDFSALEAYRKAVEMDSADGRSQFRLGVALRSRYDSRHRRSGDAQAAVKHWGLALAIDPNQYIWRRRIQQYGPRLDKPYNFYFWVDQARTEIEARGETPVTLPVEPVGSEIAPPAKGARPSSRGLGPARTSALASRCGSQADRIQRDNKHFVSIEPVVTPARVRPGHLVRARLTFRVNEKTRPYWNNEADDLVMCLDVPKNVTVREGLLTYPNPNEPETQEDRAVEFEIAVGETTKTGPLEIPAHALYYVCENKGGKCRYLRQDFTVTLNVDPSAPTLR